MRTGFYFFLICLTALSACTGDGEPPRAPASTTSPEESEESEAGCAAGEVAVDGACRPAGIPEDSCGEGFVSDGSRGCRPIIPTEACTRGLMAIPGEETCHQITTCPTDRWSDEPLGANTQYVDQAYAGADSDGTRMRPWIMLADAIEHAAPGATVAITDGVYVGNIVVTKRIYLRGRCPQLVELRGEGQVFAAIDFKTGSGGSTVSRLAITGKGGGLRIRNVSDVTLDHLWLHDISGFALWVGSSPATAVMLRRSLIEDVNGAAVACLSATLAIEDSVLRNTTPQPDLPGVGITVQRRKGSADLASITISGSIIENHPALGVGLFCSNGRITASVIRRNGTAGPNGGGIDVGSCDDATNTKLTVSGSLIEQNARHGVSATGVDVEIDTTVISDTTEKAVDDDRGVGVIVTNDDLHPDQRLVVSWSLLTRNQNAAIVARDVTALLTGIVVRDQIPGSLSGLSNGLIVVTTDQTEVVVLGSRFENHVGIGIALYGANARLERVLVADTYGVPQPPSATSGLIGVGILIAHDSIAIRPSVVAIEYSEVVRSEGIGIQVVNARAELSHCRIADTTAIRDADIADGLTVQSLLAGELLSRGHATLRNSVIEHNGRTGISNFGADMRYADNDILCNAIAVDGESDAVTDHHSPFTFEDDGNNRCGCGNVLGACEVVTSHLLAPEPRLVAAPDG